MKVESLLSALETIQLILSFGMFTIALIKLIVDMLKNDKKHIKISYVS
ncbi:putative holin-like toxin [Enterococcus sp. AZ126]